MTHYPDPRINQALGIEGSADMDDTLAAIARLRAYVADAARLQTERDEARNERARLDHNYRLLQQHVSSLEDNLEKTERARDAAFCAIHHATARYAV
jgi:chromosome segregation ATPase